MRDSQMFLRSTTAALTSTETSSAFTGGPFPLDGMNCVVIVPSQSSGTTFDVTLQESTNGSTWTTFETFTTLASTTLTTSPAVVQARRFQSPCQQVRSVATVAGTSPSYGAVQIYLDDGPGNANWFLGWQALNPASPDTRPAVI